MMTTLPFWMEQLTSAVEAELRAVLALSGDGALDGFRAMMAYHLGWEGEGAGPAARGKRVRPVLLLLTTAAAGGAWAHAVPAAAAVELVHNFSLIHDDIEDDSPLRRGRPTVWKVWGIPQAINVGDGMFALAHLALLRLERFCPPEAVLRAAHILHQTCLHLTQGQYLDIAYAARQDLKVADYWPMVGGKTAALLAACTHLGALVAGVDEPRQQAFRQFGELLGLAFQVLDDYLGIWGDQAQTGKSAASDLVEGKKTLPVLYALERDGAFARRWRQGPVQEAEVPHLAALLAEEGAQAYTRQVAADLTERALQALQNAAPEGEAGQALEELARRLLRRQR